MAKQNNKTAKEQNVEFDELTSTEGFFDKYKNIQQINAVQKQMREKAQQNVD